MDNASSHPNADTTAWEPEIDQLMYQLCNQTPEKIDIVEESTWPSTSMAAGRWDKLSTDSDHRSYGWALAWPRVPILAAHWGKG